MRARHLLYSLFTGFLVVTAIGAVLVARANTTAVPVAAGPATAEPLPGRATPISAAPSSQIDVEAEVSRIPGAKVERASDGVAVVTLADSSQHVAVAGQGPNGIVGFVSRQAQQTPNPIVSLKACNEAAGVGAEQCKDMEVAVESLDDGIYGKYGIIVRDLDTGQTVGEIGASGFFSTKQLRNGEAQKAIGCTTRAHASAEQKAEKAGGDFESLLEELNAEMAKCHSD